MDELIKHRFMIDDVDNRTSEKRRKHSIHMKTRGRIHHDGRYGQQDVCKKRKNTQENTDEPPMHHDRRYGQKDIFKKEGTNMQTHGRCGQQDVCKKEGTQFI